MIALSQSPKRSSFWSTAPGLITAFAGLLGGVGTLVVSLNQAGFFGRSRGSSESDPTTQVQDSLLNVSPGSGPVGSPQNQPWLPGVYMHQAVNQVLSTAATAGLAAGYRLISDQVSAAAAFVQVGASISWHMRMSSGREYTVIAVGDQDVTDLDIRVLDAAGNVVVKDVETDATPVVSYTPLATGQYEVLITLYDADAPSFVAMAILSDSDPLTMPMDRLAQAAERYRQYGERVNNIVGNARFHDAPGEWAVYGMILAAGGTMQINNIDLTSGGYVFVATADDSAEDIDLVLRGPGDRVVGEDTEVDATPIVLHTAQTPGTYRANVVNLRSHGPSFVILTVLGVSPG